MKLTPKGIAGMIIGGLVLGATGLAIYFKRQANLIMNACYTISGGVVHSLGLSNVSMTLFFKIINESDLTIEVSNMDFMVYVNGMFVSNILKPDKQTLLSNSDIIVSLDVQFNPADLLKAGLNNISQILTDKSKLVIGIKGSFSAKVGLVTLKKFPIDESITLKEIMTPSPTPKKC